MSKSWRYMRQEILEESQYSDDDTGYDNSGIEESIFTCIVSSDTAQLRNIIDRGVHLDFTNRYGEGPLHLAVSQEEADDILEILDLLLYFGCPLTTQNRFGETPLHIAAKDSPKFVERLLQAGAAVNARDNAGRTALMLAAGSKSEKALLIVQFLLDWGAGVHYNDGDGQTALHYVCKQHLNVHLSVQMEIIYKLLYAGIDVNIKDHQGLSAVVPLYMRAANSVNQVRLFREIQAMIKILTRGGAKCIQEQNNILRSRVFINPFSVFCICDITIFEPVTPTSEYKQFYQLLQQIYYPDRSSFPVDSVISAIKNSVKKTLGQTRTLKQLSRIVIREQLNGKVMVLADKLRLPSTLADYLTYPECV